MIKKRFQFWMILLVNGFIICLSTPAAIYYVDAGNGSDSNSGVSEATAWRSLEKVNRSLFQPGDQILLKRGDRWQGRLEPLSSGDEGKPIVFGAYGSANRAPVIVGAEWITAPRYQWQRSRGGKNEYYLTLQGGGNPDLTAPTYIWRNHRLLENGTAGSLLNRSWDYADKDSLGFRTIYIRDDSGNPSVTGVRFEYSKERYCLGIFGKHHLLFEEIVFEKSASRIVTVEENSRSISFVRCTFRQSYGPLVHLLSGSRTSFRNCRFEETHGIGSLLKMAGTSSEVKAEYCLFDDSNGYSVEIENGLLADFTHCLFIGSNLGHISNISSITANAVNCIFSVPGKARASANFRNNGSGKIAIDHCVVMPNGHSPKQENRSTVIEKNTIRKVPRFVSHRDKGIITFIMDDTPNFGRWKDVANIAERYGYRISMALYGRDMTERDWQDAATYAARGHEIASHSRSHAYLTERDSFSIRYVGNASQASLSFDGRYFTTQLIGHTDSSKDLQIDTSDARYDTFQEISRFINDQTGYKSSMTTQWHTRVSASSLANVNQLDIKQNRQVEIDKSRFFYDEIVYAKQEIEKWIPGYQCRSFVYPGGDYDNEIVRYVRDAGFSIARSVIPTQEFLLEDLDIMEIGALDVPTFVDLNDIETSIHAICETANYTGSLRVLFDHANLSLNQYEQIFAALQSYGDIQVMTLARAGEYIRTLGEDREGNGLRWSVPPTGTANYHLRADSPLINAGIPVGLNSDMDGFAVPYGSAPDIGLYEWPNTTQDNRTPVPTSPSIDFHTPTPLPTSIPVQNTPTPSATNVPILNLNNLLAKGLTGFFFQEDWPQNPNMILSRLPNGIDTLEIRMRYPAILYSDIPVIAEQQYQFKSIFRSDRTRKPSIYFENPATKERISDQQTIHLGSLWQDIFIVLTAETSLSNAQLVINDGYNTTGRIWLSQPTLKGLTTVSQDPTPIPATDTPTTIPTATATPQSLPTHTPTYAPIMTPTSTPFTTSVDDWKELDVSGDGKINKQDLVFFLQDWRKDISKAEHPVLDTNYDGKIACEDLLVLIYYWNRSIEIRE